MSTLGLQAALFLAAAMIIAFAYELYRATAKAGVSRHDNMRVFATQGLPTYVVGALVIAALLAGWSWAPAAALAFTVAIILVSLFYYNPRIMPERRPELIDWLEDLVFTGLLFVAAALLAYETMGWKLLPG
jgi:phosphatidylserine synthase